MVDLEALPGIEKIIASMYFTKQAPFNRGHCSVTGRLPLESLERFWRRACVGEGVE